MSREFNNKITSAIHAVYSAFMGVNPKDNPFCWYDKTFRWGNFKITAMSNEEDGGLVENFVWEKDEERLVVEWYKYWPRGIEMNATEVSDSFYEDVGDLVKFILCEFDPNS